MAFQRGRLAPPKPGHKSFDSKDPGHWYRYGLECLNEHKWKESAEAFEEAARADSSDGASLSMLGGVYLLLEERDKAEEVLERLRKVSPGEAQQLEDRIRRSLA